MSTENRCPECGVELRANAPRGLCPACLLKGGLDTQSHLSGGGAPPAGGDFTPPTLEQLAARFPELEVLEFIGRGGMGMVYKVRQKRLDRLVALKILLPNIARDPAFAERFEREARALARLGHPHIVTVYDFGQKDSPRPLAGEGPGVRAAEGGKSSEASPHPNPLPEGEGTLYYFLMEYVDGVTLRQLLDAGRLAPQEALAIVPQVCEALQYAHDQGIVHRDIKPENILMDRRGQVKIADFGLAKLVGQPVKDFTITGTGQVMGTPHYMAPEQFERPQEVDHRADIYSLGVVFYQMLTGELPIGRFAPPSRKVQVDVRLDEVVLRTLEKEPERRYQHASEVKTEVETILQTPEKRGPAMANPDSLEDARSQVQGPAIGLLVTGILNWLTVPLIVVVMAYMTTSFGAARGIFVVPTIIALLASLLFSSFVIFAALKMKQLEAYGPAIAASILAILIAPSNLIGLAIGIWSLVVLNRHDVRTAFAAKERSRPPRPPVPPRQRALGTAALMVTILAIPLAVLGPRIFASMGNSSWFMVAMFSCGPQLLALAMAIAGRKSLPAKIALVLATLGLLLAALLTAAAVYLSIHRDFGGTPGLERFPPAAQANSVDLAQGPLEIPPLPAGWAVIFTKADRIREYRVSIRPDSSDNLSFSRNPPPDDPENIAASVQRRANDFVGMTSRSMDIEIVNKKYTVKSFAGPHCQGHYAIFHLTGALYPMEAIFAMSVDGQVWSGGFAGNPDDWEKALGLLKTLRKKGAQAEQAAAYSGQPASAETAQFGPVVEITAGVLADRNNMVSLETGRIVGQSVPLDLPVIEGRTFEETRQKEAEFFRSVGADLWGEGTTLRGLDLAAKQVEQKAWDEMSPAAARAAIAGCKAPAIERLEVRMPRDLPETYVFRTRKGSVGLLQVTEILDGPQRVKIRYKLVRGEPTATSPAATPPTEASTATTSPKAIPPEAATRYFEVMDLQMDRLAINARLNDPGGAQRRQAAESEMKKATEDWQALSSLLQGTEAEGILERGQRQGNMLKDPQVWQNPASRRKMLAEGEIVGFQLASLMLRAGAPANVRRDAAGLAFSPWREVALSTQAAGGPCAITFETGKTLTPPAEVLKETAAGAWLQLRPKAEDSSAAVRWVLRSGCDVVAAAPNELVMLSAIKDEADITDSTMNPQWDSQLTPQWLLWELNLREKDMRAFRQGPGGPLRSLDLFVFGQGGSEPLCLFRTRAGQSGVLQVVGSTEKTVRIRYKLLQTAAANASPLIQIARGGSLTFQGKPATLKDLAAKLEKAGVGKKHSITLQASPDTLYNDLAKVMDQLGKAGYTQLSLQTAKDESAKPSANLVTSKTLTGIVAQLLAKWVAAEKQRTGAALEGYDKPQFAARAIADLEKQFPQVFTVSPEEEQRLAAGRFDDASSRKIIRKCILVFKDFQVNLPALSQYLIAQAEAERLQGGELEVTRRILEAQVAKLRTAILTPDAVEPSKRPAASLEFHVVPNAPGSSQKPVRPKFVGNTKDDFAAAAVKELAEKGPASATLGGKDYQWRELAGDVSVQDTLVGTHKDKKYVLLCAKEPYAMLPKKEGPDAWKLEQVSTSKDDRGMPQIEFRFDRRGGELFATLTKENILNHLATVVGGRVVSAPRINSVIYDRGVITGQFTEQEVQDMANLLTAEGRTAAPSSSNTPSRP